MIPILASGAAFIPRQDTLRRARAETAYRFARAVVNVAALLGMIAVILSAFMSMAAFSGAFASLRELDDRNGAGVPGSLMIVSGVVTGIVGLCVVEGLRQLAVLFIDIADLQIAAVNALEIQQAERAAARKSEIPEG